MTQLDTRQYRGWTLVTMQSEQLDVVVTPEKGGDVASVRWRATDTELMFQTRWGLRHRGVAAQPGSSEAALTEWYPGGWQTQFPNAGDATVEHGVEWAFHGETWITAFDWRIEDERLVMDADLVRSPFHVRKTVELRENRVCVSEQITNVGAEPVEVMWGQHPAFGAPLLSAETEIFTNARTIRLDSDGVAQAWPVVQADGEQVDMSRIPGAGSGISRMAYLSDFDGEASLGVANRNLGLRAELTWDPAAFPLAWYWLEAGGRGGFPWYRAAYALGLEPNTSWPGHGMPAARRTGSQIVFAPGETRTGATTLAVTAID